MAAFGLGVVTWPLRGQEVKSTFPGANWERIAAPEDYGYSGVKLNALRTWLKTPQTKGLLVRSAVASSSTMATRIMLVSKIASTRKSVLDMLYGNIVANGKVDPQKTVKDIGLEEVRKFLPVEENPTLEMQHVSLRHLSIHKRGTGKSGASNRITVSLYISCYQTWDFDATGSVFEKLTGRKLNGPR
jgi:hypothetical protein